MSEWTILIILYFEIKSDGKWEFSWGFFSFSFFFCGSSETQDRSFSITHCFSFFPFTVWSLFQQPHLVSNSFFPCSSLKIPMVYFNAAQALNFFCNKAFKSVPSPVQKKVFMTFVTTSCVWLNEFGAHYQIKLQLSFSRQLHSTSCVEPGQRHRCVF